MGWVLFYFWGDSPGDVLAAPESQTHPKTEGCAPGWDFWGGLRNCALTLPPPIPERRRALRCRWVFFFFLPPNPLKETPRGCLGLSFHTQALTQNVG